MIRTFGAYRCFATILIKFAVRQSCKHVDSLRSLYRDLLTACQCQGAGADVAGNA